MYQDLDELESRTLYILREAFAKAKPLCMLWSIGKDSNALLWMARKAFFGVVPFPLVQLDTGMELPEVYEFRDMLVKSWALDIKVEECPPESEVDQTLPPASRSAARKTAGLRNLIQRDGYRGIFLGIRRDEQSMRAKERVFSPRTVDGAWDFKDQTPEFWNLYHTEVPEKAHIRIHPILHWTELDIWRYTQRENIPIVPLYLARNGMRYRSLGERNITFPIVSNASSISEIITELATTREPERAGRAMDRETEDSFERLRAAGYM
ncbi:sulfate adenylyltransferase subunit 2 [Azospirillaceae bacterium]